MSKKTYLSHQIKLMSIATYDLFTDEEYAVYEQIIACINQSECAAIEEKENDKTDPTIRLGLSAKKKKYQEQLSALIASHRGTPRTVRIKSVINPRTCKTEDDTVVWPEGVTWKTLRTAKKVAEFASEESRAMGLKHLDVTFDKIIVKWKSLDVLKQIVTDGFCMTVLQDNGTPVTKHYRFMTASAGQLRTDKIQCISDEAWQKIYKRLECGLDWSAINKKGGINANKYMAYLALTSSATDLWEDVSIDNCIVVEDFEAPVTDVCQYIKPDYTSEIGEKTITINHCDGIGMMLPKISTSNFMVRGPWLKGLLTSFDFLKFCQVNHCDPVIKDVWGTSHHLINENISIIFTKSQLKLWKYYDDWEHYKRCFKENGCTFNRTNFEEEDIADTDMCYQMLQTLTDFTDEEINTFVKRTKEKINGIAQNSASMLRVLRADKESENPYCRALSIYPELLRDAYARETLKAVKKRWLLDAKSGKIRCQNKRLFAIPDMYAACEFWFLHNPEPKGLLKNGEVACRPYFHKNRIDCLRSPHLYMEHAIRNVVKDPNVYDWLYTGGCYTSCHDLISRILQFDVDGDQLNCVADELLITVADRNIKKYHVVPLYYDLEKADPLSLTSLEMFNGLKRAHDHSGIGQVSNSLTKLWNRPNPDREVAAWLCYYNNQVIDAAKTGKINAFENYPGVEERVNRAVGGKNGRMPYFFQFSKNGRKTTTTHKKKTYAKQNDATMNRICERFSDIGNINLNYAKVPPFNWQMMIKKDALYRIDAVERFCEIDSSNLANLIEASGLSEMEEKANAMGYEFMKETIVDELIALCGNLENAYPSVVKYLFAGDNAKKSSHKQMFWRVFGEIACDAVLYNAHHHTVCPRCGMKIPFWTTEHVCPKSAYGFFECVDCGKVCERTNSKQRRCKSCQETYNKIANRMYHKQRYQ